VNRLIGAVLTVGLAVTLSTSAVREPSIGATRDQAAFAAAMPAVTLLDMHPVDPMYSQTAKSMGSMPVINRPGASPSPDPRQIPIPAVVTPNPVDSGDPSIIIGKAGTGFFVGDDGTLLTAAHVVNECSRMQVISKYLPRTWVSLVVADQEHDIAVLRAIGTHPPAIVRMAAGAPASAKLFILGYPASADLTTPAETWAVVENAKFPPGIGPLVNPRELLWMSAPGVEHGYSGGPIFDPKLGAVVGLVKGEVEGGYLRLVRDMPTTGIAIGPGVEHIAALLRRQAAYTPASFTAASGETGEDTLRRATVHVLCWH
jgi:S1-C subfamily serine protease